MSAARREGGVSGMRMRRVDWAEKQWTEPGTEVDEDNWLESE